MFKAFGGFANSIAMKIAVIAIGPVLGLGLTMGVNRHAEQQRLATDTAYKAIQERLAHVDDLSNALTLVNSQVSNFLDTRSADMAKSIQTGIAAAEKELGSLQGVKDEQAAKLLTSLKTRVGSLRFMFKELDDQVEVMGRTSHLGLTEELDKMTEILLALFDGAVSMDDRFRPLSNSYSDFRGTELRYRWKRDAKLENRIEFMRAGLITQLSRVEFDPQQAQMLRDGLDRQGTAFVNWKAGAQNEVFQRNAVIEHIAAAQAETNTLRTRAAELMARERTANESANDSAARLVLLAAALSAAISIALIIFVGRGLANALAELASSMRRVAEGEANVAVPSLARKDEIGTMAQALRVFQTSIEERASLAQRAEHEQQDRLARARRIETVITSFGATIEAAITRLKQSATSMHAAAETLDHDSRTLVEHAGQAGHATATASGEVSSVAVSASQLTASIEEVSRQAVRSTDVANHAVAQSRRASEMMEGLVEEASRIGDVVALIRSITEQTNLLALNATIEAARAGESGKGFAVVASEVKALAAQTAHATEEIAIKVNAIQGASADVGDAIGAIDKILSEMSAIAASVAAAVEEQSSAISTISDNVNVAARSAEDGAQAIREAESRASAGRQTATDVAQAAQAVSVETQSIEGRISQFLSEVRVA